MAIYSFLGGIGAQGYDYTGSYNLAMFQKWQSLSKDPESVGRMLNIIWADVAANYLTGTRGWGTGKNVTASSSSDLRKRQNANGGQEQAQQTVLVPVRLYEKKVQYHWLYAIPAFMAMALFLTTLAASCCCTILRRGGPKRTRFYLNHLSAGRLLGEQRYPGAVNGQAPTKEWLNAVGKRKVALRDSYAYGTGVASPAMGGGGSPYIGGGGQGGYFGESKPGANSSATELHRLHPMGGQSPLMGQQGYMRVQS